MIYDSRENSRSYYPVFAGNGDIAFPTTCEGTIDHRQEDFPQYTVHMSGAVYRAGRRLIHWNHPLVPFGTLSFGNGGRPIHFTHEFLLPEALQRSVCQYPDGSVVDSEFFLAYDRPLYLLRKTYHGKTKNVSYVYDITSGGRAPQNVFVPCLKYSDSRCAVIGFTIFGRDRYVGELRLLADTDFAVSFDGKRCVFEKEVSDGETFTFGFFLEDDFRGADYEQSAKDAESEFRTSGFDGLLCESSDKWRKYFEGYYVKTGDETADAIYRTCLYHLKCNTTEWSIPVGLNGNVWNGRYFAFDEYYCMLALLTSGRFELAKRVPGFRLLNVGAASTRAMGGGQLRYIWEANEYCEEGAPPGHWLDHVFHMAVIASGAFEYYEYTLDRDFLGECYPMISGCAKFYTENMLYEDSNGKIFVGRCTDLERLGNSKLNPFMTACGIIKTLRVTARASEILGIDEEYRARCIDLAERLRENLPQNSEMYIPYDKAECKSIGVLAGKFPFDVLENTDEKMLRAIRDYTENSHAVGNMYNVGSNICPWYACWEALTYARLGEGDDAYRALREVYKSVGVFYNVNEINEPTRQHHPWFATGAGTFINAVNEMLVRCDGDNVIEILPAYNAEGKDVSFRLPIKGGRDIEVEIRSGKLTKASVLDRTTGLDITSECLLK